MQSQATHDAYAHLQAVYTFMTGMTTFRHFVDDLLSSWPDDDDMLVHASDDIDWMTVVHYKACVVRLLHDGQWSKAADIMCRAVEIEVQWRTRDWSLCYLEVMYGVGFGEKCRRMEKEEVEKWLGLTFSEISGHLLKQSGQHDMESNSNNEKEPSQPPIQLGKIIGNFAPKIMTFFRYLGHSISSTTITVPEFNKAPAIKYCWEMKLKYDYNRVINICIKSDEKRHISFEYLRSLAENYLKFPFLFVKCEKSQYIPIDDSSKVNWGINKSDISVERYSKTHWISRLVSTNQSSANNLKYGNNSQNRIITFYHERQGKVAIICLIADNDKPREAATMFSSILSEIYSIPKTDGICTMIKSISFKDTIFKASQTYDFSSFFTGILKEKLKKFEKCKSEIKKDISKEFFSKEKNDKLTPTKFYDVSLFATEKPKFIVI